MPIDILDQPKAVHRYFKIELNGPKFNVSTQKALEFFCQNYLNITDKTYDAYRVFKALSTLIATFQITQELLTGNNVPVAGRINEYRNKINKSLSISIETDKPKPSYRDVQWVYDLFTNESFFQIPIDKEI